MTESPVFRTSELRQALERPRMEVDGVVYVGRLLSWEESLSWLPRPERWTLAETADEVVEKEVKELVDLMDFTATDGSNRKFRGEDFAKLERAIVGAAIVYFFRCLRQSVKRPDDGVNPDATTEAPPSS